MGILSVLKGKDLRMNKKGQLFSNFSALAIGGLVLAVTLAVVFVIFSQVAANSQISANANATDAVNTVQGGVADIPGWVPLAILAVLAVVILGIVRGLNRA